jgi:hypothetical protein
VKRWSVILGVVAACGVGVWMLEHRQAPTTEQVAAPSSFAARYEADPAPEQEQASSAEESKSVETTRTASAPAATGGTLRGRLVDAVTRQPVKEFEVRLVRVQRGPEWREEKPLTQTFQSDIGRFAWTDVPAETWKASVSAHGYQQFRLGEVTIAAGKKTREVVMPMQRGFAVRGRVFAAATGAGIPEAYVSFRVASAWGDVPDDPYAQTKEDGSFELDGVPSGEISLIAGAKGYASRTAEIVMDDKTPPQEFALSTGGRIAGVVKTATGEPVKGRVMMGGGSVGYGNETTDSGQFSFDNVAAGRYEIQAHSAAGSARQEIVLGQDERRDDIVLTLSAGHAVRGMVKGVRAEQFGRTFIGLRSNSMFFSARADERGAYAFAGVPPGRARVTVYAGDRQLSKVVDVPAEQDITLDLIFPAGARLSGRVTQGGKPATQRTVWMQPADTKDGLSYRATTSADGQYEIEGLPLGDYRVTADEDISRTVTMAGDTVLNIDIPSVQIAGRVVEDGSSVPIVGAYVYLRGIDPATARVYGGKQSNDFGEFSLTGIEPGEVALIVYTPGYELYREKLAYAAPIKGKTIALRKSSGVEVRVQAAANDEPVRGILVTQTIPGSELGIHLWIPLNREGVGSLPSALAGSHLMIEYGRAKPLVIDEWDGQPLELKP